MAKILIVEDSPLQQELYQEFVELWGHECLVSDNASDAVRLAEEARPPVVIMDLSILVSPNGIQNRRAGADALQAMRLKPSLARTRVIAITAQPEYRHYAPDVDDHAFQVVIKPFRPDFEDLRQAVESALTTPYV